MDNVNSISGKMVKEMIREKEQQMPDSGQVDSIGGEMVQEQEQQIPGFGQTNPTGSEMVRRMIMNW